MTLPSTLAGLGAALNGAASLMQQLRLTAMTVKGWLRPARPAHAYETLWLELFLDLQDPRGERAVLTRRQRVRFLGHEGALVRELVWGEGEQLIRYHAAGARRLGVRPEGSRRAVLLDPETRPVAGDQLTIESRRTIKGGFHGTSEYCEVYLERPTGRMELTVIFPSGRPPKRAQLVHAATETVLRNVPTRYRADGRAVLRCRLRSPDPATTFSLRWTW